LINGIAFKELKFESIFSNYKIDVFTQIKNIEKEARIQIKNCPNIYLKLFL
jgi:hypothetical protein